MKRKLFDNLKRKYTASVLAAVFGVSAFSNCVRAMNEKDNSSESLIIPNNFHLENNNNNDEEQQLNPEECMVGKVKGSDILKAVKECNKGKSYETIPEGKDLLKAMGLGGKNIDEILQGTGLDINSLPKRNDLIIALAIYSKGLQYPKNFDKSVFLGWLFDKSGNFKNSLFLDALSGLSPNSNSVFSNLLIFYEKFFCYEIEKQYGKEASNFYSLVYKKLNRRVYCYYSSFWNIPQGEDLLDALGYYEKIDNEFVSQLPTCEELLAGLVIYYIKSIENYNENNLKNYVKVFCEEKLFDDEYFNNEFLKKAVSNCDKDENPFLGKLKPYCKIGDNESPKKRLLIFGLEPGFIWFISIGIVLFIAMVITIMVVGKKVNSIPNEQKAPNNETADQKTGKENNSSEFGDSSNTRNYAQTTKRITLAAFGAAAGEGIAFLSGNVQSNGEKIESEVNLLKNSEMLGNDPRENKIKKTETNSSANIITEKSKDPSNKKSKSKKTVGGAF